MTHYRLTLTAGKAPATVMLAEVHKDVPRLEQGWGRKMRASKAVSAHLRQCYVPDEECNSYQAWLDSKTSDEAKRLLDEALLKDTRETHTDDIEAEKLRGEDLQGAGP